MNGTAHLNTREGRTFILILCILSVGLGTVSALSYRDYSRNFRADADRQLSTIADLKVSQLAQWRGQRLDDAAILFRNSAFIALVRRACSAPPDMEARQELHSWLSRYGEDPQYGEVLLVDARGAVQASVPASAGSAAAGLAPGIAQALRAGRPALQDFYRDPADGTIHLAVLVPVIDEASSDPALGVVVLRIAPETYLYPYIKSWPVPSRTAETLLARRDGENVVFLNPLRFDPDAALRLRIPLASPDLPAARVARGDRGVVKGHDYRGHRVIAALRAVPDSPWLVVARMDESEVYAPLGQRLWQTILFGLILMFSAGAGLWLILGRRLRESESRLRVIAESAHDAILMMDPEGRVTFWNPAAERAFGHASAEVIGRKLHELLAPQRYHESFQAAHAEFRRRGRGAAIGRTLDLRALTKDGRELPVELSLSAVMLDGGWHAVGILRDVSESKLAKADLEQANNELEAAIAQANALAFEAQAANIAKSQFLANMSHEIRTPMNGIIGMTELLMDSGLTDEQRRDVEIVRSSSDALLRIINDILDFSKIEANKLDLESVDFDLRAMVEDTVRLMAPRAQEKQLELICRIDPELHTSLRGDPGRVRQILVNLIGNAIKFTAEGEIIVEVDPESEADDYSRVFFAVKDTGIGVPADKIASLFNAFQQADASSTRQFGGTGLGLAISKRLAEMMGGQIGGVSHEGAGATFWFTATFVKQSRDDRAPETAAAVIRGVRVLVVDDTAMNRRVLAEHLSPRGVRVAEAGSAAEAIGMLRAARAEGDPFRVVLTDMQMPEMDGEALGRSVKADPELRDTLLVIMVSLGRRGDAKRLEAAGFSAYLTKPVVQADLYDCLATVLRERGPQSASRGPALVTRHTLSEARRHRARILLAEDNPVNRQVVLRLLGKLGVHVDAVGNGRDAIKALEAAPYDLVLMDLQMPDLDGLEATRMIRGGGTKVLNPRIPIIALTAHAMTGDRERCLEVGMDDHLGKPVSATALAAALEKWLNLPSVA